MRTYQLIRSRRKSVALVITQDGALQVRAPLRLSKKWIDGFVNSKEAWIEAKTAELLDRRQKEIHLTPEQEAALRRDAEAYLPNRAWELAQQTGLMPSRVRVGSAKTRWGSCSGKNSVNLSWRLMLAPKEAVDYVIIHELCHIRELNHSPRFWALVESFLPDYRRRREMLRR